MRRDIPTTQEHSLETLFKALANRRRLIIIRHLKKHGEKSVTELADVIGVSVKSMSKHLLILRGRGWYGLTLLFIRVANQTGIEIVPEGFDSIVKVEWAK